MSSKEGQDNGDVKKIKIISSSKKSCKTFVFTNEDHTLGNSLRYALMRKYVRELIVRSRIRPRKNHTHTFLTSPKVEFCGYTVPHPMEPKMNVRLQTKDAFDATEVMKESLDVLVDIFDVVDEKFQKASKAFKPSS